MDTFSCVGGNTVLYFVLLLDRNISESTQRFQWVIPEDSVTFQQAERAPGLRPGRGQGNTGRQREERAERNPKRPKKRGIVFDQVWGKEGRNKAGVLLRKAQRRENQNVAGRGERSWARVRVWGCSNSVEILEFIPCSNQSPLTWRGLWQIIPAPLRMTQSAWRIAFWWAIGLLVYQPNHPLMTSSTRSLHFSKWKAKGDLEINLLQRYLLSEEDL